MIYVLIPSMMLVFYLSVVYGTYMKFKYEGLGLERKGMFALLPITLFFLNTKATLRLSIKDSGVRVNNFFFYFFKYPVLLGVLMENAIYVTKENDGDLTKISKRELQEAGNDFIYFYEKVFFKT